MSLTDDEIDRYARHLVLPEVGGPGQQKLTRARVLVIGAGGLGAPALLYLAAAGVGTLGIVDDDAVDLSNLQRQVIHTTARVGQAKTASAAAAIAALNPHVRVETHDTRLTRESAEDLVRGHDLVLDGSDNFATRFAVHDACFALRVPLVSGAVGRFDGQITVWRGFEPDLPCLHCFMPEPDAATREATCAEAGILGALTGIVGSLQAFEAIRAIVGFGEGLAGRLMLYDGLSATVRTIRIPKDPGCPLCGPGRDAGHGPHA